MGQIQSVKMKRQLEEKILSLRGGLFILRDLQPLIDKATEDQLASLLQLVRTVEEEGTANGAATMKSKARRNGFFL